jgi:hypothetical protein
MPFQPPTFGKSSTPYPESLPCQDDIDSCHSSMSTDGANMRLRNVDSTKSRLHIRTPGAHRLEENRHLPGSGTAHGVQAGRLAGACPLPTAVATGAASSCAPAACWAGGRAHASPGRCVCGLKERPGQISPRAVVSREVECS